MGLQTSYQLSRPNLFPEIDLNTTGHAGFGLVFLYQNEEHAATQLEFLYSQTSWESGAADTLFGAKMQYVDIPVSAHFQILKSQNRITINAGLFGRYLLDETYPDRGNLRRFQSANLNSEELPTAEIFSGGVHAGLGFARKTRRGLLLFECRYITGLRDMYQEEESPFTSSLNQSLSLKLSYLFGFKRMDRE